MSDEIFDVDDAKEKLLEFLNSDLQKYWDQKPSESDTRSKVIDVILKDVLGWPEDNILREGSVESGYVDYVLSTTHPYYVVEAKRISHDIPLPEQSSKRAYKIGGVLKENASTIEDMKQARDYARDQGVNFCCLTNGYRFVFFRSQNDQGLSWDNHLTIVFRSLEEVSERFSEFYSLLSYESVTQGDVHTKLPASEGNDKSESNFKLLDRGNYYLPRTRERNKFFLPVRGIITHVFQDIYDKAGDPDLLKNCYVESARDSAYEKGLDGLMKQKPVDWGLGSQSISVQKKNAGAFQSSIEESLNNLNDNPEVILILGGVGVGKTTFIHRFRYVLAKNEIDERALWSYVDFNRFSDTGESLIKWTCSTIVESLEEDYPSININDFSFLKVAYHKEYEKLKRGRLKPFYDKSQSEFDIKFSEELERFEEDIEAHTVRLVKAVAGQLNRRIFFVFDNADQFGTDTQDGVFRIAQKLSKDTGGACVISLREESYWKNKEFGALSAFPVISFHVQAPRLQQVISKRFKYAKTLIENGENTQYELSDGNSVTREELANVLDIVGKSILGNDDGRYLELLERLSPFEVRRPLNFLAKFLYSGHTNLDATLRAWRKKGEKVAPGFHEFFEAIALGDNEVYEENKSDIINLFCAEGTEDISNLNRIIVIGEILANKDNNSFLGRGFFEVEELMKRCERFGILPDTVRRILALSNAKRLCETETQIKEGIDHSRFIRARPAAQYYLDKLIYEFAYLNIILQDTALRESPRQRRIFDLSEEISGLTSDKKETRFKRLSKRLERSKEFVLYLSDEFERSTASQYRGELDPCVVRFFDKGHGAFLKQQRQIEARAKKVFGI